MDWDLLEAEVEEEEAAAEVEEEEASGSVSIKDDKTPTASSSPSSCYYQRGLLEGVAGAATPTMMVGSQCLSQTLHH